MLDRAIRIILVAVEAVAIGFLVLTALVALAEWSQAQAAPPVIKTVLRGWDAAIQEPYILVVVSGDASALQFTPSGAPTSAFGIAISAATSAGYFRCDPANGQWRTCRWYLGAHYCAVGSANACTMWIDQATHTSPKPVLPHDFITVTANKQTGTVGGNPVYQTSPAVTEAHVEAACLCIGGTMDKQACLSSGAACPGLKRNGQPAQRSSGAPCRVYPNGAPGVQAGEQCQYP